MIEPCCDQTKQSNSQNLSSDNIYTCPMHPEIEQIGPGSCPICGMALEPKGLPAGEEDTSELNDMTKRFWVSAALSAFGELSLFRNGNVDCIYVSNTCDGLGGFAYFQKGLAFNYKYEIEHVYPDYPRHWGCLYL